MAASKKELPGWLGQGAEPDDYLITYEPGGRESPEGWYIVDQVRRNGELGNEIAQVAIGAFGTKAHAMKSAFDSAHGHAKARGIQSAVVWRVGGDDELHQIGHVGASHRQPVISNPGPGSDEDEDDEDLEGDLRYANPNQLAERLKNAF